MSWLTPKEAAEYLGVAKTTLLRYRHGQGLPPEAKPPRASVLGRVIRYRPEWLDEFMAQFEVDDGAEMDRIVEEIWEKIR